MTILWNIQCGLQEYMFFYYGIENGLFSDDDLEYIQYHQKALKIFFQFWNNPDQKE